MVKQKKLEVIIFFASYVVGAIAHAPSYEQNLETTASDCKPGICEYVFCYELLLLQKSSLKS